LSAVRKELFIMSASSTIGLETFLTMGDAVPTVLVPTAITKAAPAEVTVASVAGIADGDLAHVGYTGFPELDNRWFIVGAVDDTANSFTLVGSDTTGSTATLGPTPDISVTSQMDMVKMCLSAVEPAAESAGTTSVGTFCDPTASIPAISQAGTLTLTGFVELGAYYSELLLAVEDQKERVLDVKLPQNLGDIVVPAVLSTISWALPLDGAVGFTVTGAMSTKPRHLF
jgi:hypothetical protein